MSYLVLARKWRPQTFEEVTGQEHVVSTLANAIAQGRVAHALLLCGPRGVGKTTTARLLARALNCEKGPTKDPCGECLPCREIAAGTSVDVVEIDGASNNSVDNVREIRDTVRYLPQRDRFKVYIIDEAHMLTREAWNALLKILEEPPPRVIFVFATTEPQKIQQAAPPILSRCQRFDFRRITLAGIVERLRQVLDGEGIEVDDDALITIARRAEGGMRDALSLLDQVLAFAGERRVTAADVRQVLGLVGEELYLELFGIIAERRHGEVFRFVERLVDEGYDLAEFYRGLADAIRALLIFRLDGPEAVEVRDDLRGLYADRAARFGTGDLIRMLARVAEFDTEGRFRKSGNPRILLEALLLRFVHLERTIEIEELLRAAGGGDAVGFGRAGAPAPQVASATGAASPEVRRPAPAPAGGAPRGGVSSIRPRESTDATRGAVAGAPAPGSTAVAMVEPEAAPATRTEPADDSAEPRVGVGTADAAPSGRPAKSPRAAFQAMLQQGDGIPPGMGLFLKAARLVEDADGRLALEMPQGPGLDRLTSEAAARRQIEESLSRRLGRRIELIVRVQQGADGRAEPPPRLTPEQVKSDRLARLVREEPVLGAAVREWDLELLD